MGIVFFKIVVKHFIKGNIVKPLITNIKPKTKILKDTLISCYLSLNKSDKNIGVANKSTIPPRIASICAIFFSTNNPFIPVPS